MIRLAYISCVILILMVAPPAFGVKGAQRIILVGATLVDGVNNDPVPRSRIAISEGKFSCVSGPDGCPESPGDVDIDVSGLWITPGLIDTHVHLNLVSDPETTAASQRLRFALGVTTVRDAGTKQLDAVLIERSRAADTSLPVPRIVISARPMEAYAEAYGKNLGSELVRHLVELGVDGIKVKDHLSSDLFEEEIRTASELGIPVWGHTMQGIGPPPMSRTEAAIKAGLEGIAHLSWVAPFCQKPGVEISSPPADMDVHKWSKSYWLTTDSDCLDALVSYLVLSEVWLEPTLVTEWYWWRQRLEPPQELAFLRTRPPSLRDLLSGHDVLSVRRPPTFPGPFGRMTDFVGRFHEKGGMLIAGTDEVRPGLDIHAEMELFRRAGLTPFESLQTSTRNAAIALRRHDLGTIEVAKLADAVIYNSDPLDSSGTTLDIRFVVKGGIVHDSDKLLDEFRRRYSETETRLWIVRAQRYLVPLSAILLLIWVLFWAAKRMFRLRRKV